MALAIAEVSVELVRRLNGMRGDGRGPRRQGLLRARCRRGGDDPCPDERRESAMTGRATFGEFAATATRRLGETTRGIDLPDWPGSAGACADVPAAVRSAIRTLTGYAEDVCGVLGDARLAGRAELRPWIRAASQVRQRLATR